MTRSATRCLVAALACLVFLPASPSSVRAQTEGGVPRLAVPLSESLWGPAKKAYEDAEHLVASGDCATAMTKYKEAYDASGDPRLLFDMAVCARDLHHYARMQVLLLRYVQEAGDSLPPAQRVDIDAALGAIHSRVGTVKLAVSEPGADVSVDDEVVGVTPLAAPFAVDAGEHSLRVKKTGFQTVEQTIAVAGGNEATVAITFVTLVPAAHLVVSTDAAATVVVDHKRVMRGHFDERLPSGPHAVEVSQAGKRPYTAQIELADGDERNLQVTLADEAHKPLWPWIVAGAAVAAGAVIGGYFLFKPRDETSGPTGSLATVTLPP